MLEELKAMERGFDDAAAALQPFDAGTWLGLPHHGFRGFETAAELRAALEAGPVRRAVVSHTCGWLLDATQGNDALARALPELPGCVGAMTVLPEGAEIFGSLEPYVRAQLARGLRLARIFPKAHRYSLGIPTAAAMLGLLEQLGIPVMIQIGQTSMGELTAIATRHPRLALIIDSTGHHEFLNMRGVLGHLERTRNLLVSTRGQFLSGGLELLAERIGTDRILLDTNQPIDQAEASLSLLIYSYLDAADQARIAHGNLERLLAGVENGGIFA